MEERIKDLRARIDVGHTVAEELLILSGGDVDMAEAMSKKSTGLDQCKARIIDARFASLETSECRAYGSTEKSSC